jgi:hypothetical protein
MDGNAICLHGLYITRDIAPSVARLTPVPFAAAPRGTGVSISVGLPFDILTRIPSVRKPLTVPGLQAEQRRAPRRSPPPPQAKASRPLPHVAVHRKRALLLAQPGIVYCKLNMRPPMRA